jgi:hypothetical protein
MSSTNRVYVALMPLADRKTRASTDAAKTRLAIAVLVGDPCGSAPFNVVKRVISRAASRP